MKARLLKRILIPLLSVLVLILILFLVLRALFPSDVLCELAIAELEEATHLKISVEDAAISLVHWRIGVKVSGVEVSRREGEELAKVAAVPQIGVVVALGPLLKKEIVVEQVYIERPEVSLRFGGESVPGRAQSADETAAVGPRAVAATSGAGHVAATPAPGSSGAAPPAVPLVMSLSVPKAVVREGNVRLEDLRSGTIVTLNRLDVTCRMRMEKGEEIFVSEGTFSTGEVCILPGQELPFGVPARKVKGSWKVRFEPEHKLVELEKVSLRVSQLPIEIRGTVDLAGERPALDVEVRLERVGAGKVLELVPAELLGKAAELELDGQVEVFADIHGELPSPDYSGTFAFLGGSARVSDVKIDKLKASGRFDRSSVKVEEFAVSVGNSEIGGHVAVKTLEPRSVRFESSGRLNLGELAHLLPAGGGAKVKSGEVSFNVKGEGLLEELAADPLSLELQGEASVRTIRLVLPEPAPGVVIEKAHLGFSGRSVDLTETAVNVGSSVFNVSGRVHDWKERVLELELESPSLDLEELLLPLAKGRAAGKGQVPLVVPLPVGGVPLSGSGTVHVEKVTYGYFRAGELKGKLLFGGDSLVVSELTMNTLGGRCVGEGRVLLSQGGSPGYKGTFSAKGIELADLLLSFTPVKEFLTGVTFFEISVEGDLGGEVPPLNSVVATGQVSTAQAKAIASPLVAGIVGWLGLERKGEYPLEDFATSFLVEDGRLVVPRCRLVAETMTWEFSGSTGFDGTLDHEVSVIFSAEYSKRIDSLRGLERIVKDAEGRVVLDLIVGGTVRKPSVKWNLTRMEGRAKEYLAEKLRQELERGRKRSEELQKELEGELEEKLEELKKETAEKGKKLLQELFKKKKE